MRIRCDKFEGRNYASDSELNNEDDKNDDEQIQSPARPVFVPVASSFPGSSCPASVPASPLSVSFRPASFPGASSLPGSSRPDSVPASTFPVSSGPASVPVASSLPRSSRPASVPAASSLPVSSGPTSAPASTLPVSSGPASVSVASFLPGSSPRMAGFVRANEDQMRRQGRWNNTKMNGAYLTSLSREMMRSMGFPTNGRSFYLAHTALDPPTSLCKKLFPAIDEWHDRLAAKKLSPDNNHLVQVIMILRKTTIQDSVLMMELRLCHPIWQHSAFYDPAYLSFKSQVNILALECSSMLTLIC
ncbi:hypothetical protein [Absidia glauca]|uniref:Ndc10 domain-containing protein n=1 Tax=Absidia glauca TaxID=4829 RepID=A0A163KQC4_ABSGL|nr:hypothetical protein [Absidia glauca]